MNDDAHRPNPAPRPQSYLDEQFWSHCTDGILAFQRCTDCGRWRHIPRFMCAGCGSDRFTWERSSGRGTIYTYTVCYMPMSGEFGASVPYAALVVELEEGVRMTAGASGIDPDALAIGLPVECVFETTAGGATLPFFRARVD